MRLGFCQGRQPEANPPSGVLVSEPLAKGLRIAGTNPQYWRMGFVRTRSVRRPTVGLVGFAKGSFFLEEKLIFLAGNTARINALIGI